MCSQHYVGLAVGDAHGDQLVTVQQVDGHQPGNVDVAVLADERALDEAALGGEHEVAVAVEALERQHRLHVLALGEGEQVADVTAAGGALELGDVVDLLAVDAAPVGEEEEEVVGAAYEEDGVDVVLLDLGGGCAAATARLLPVGRDGRALDVTPARERDRHRLLGDQVFLADVVRQVRYGRAARIGELLPDVEQLLADDAPELDLVGEDELEAGYLFLQVAVLVVDLLALEPGEALQAHVEHGLRLRVRQLELAHEADLGLGPVLGRADEGDDRVEVVERDEVALEDMGALARFPQLEVGPAPHDHYAVVEVVAQHLLEGEDARRVLDDDHVVHGERRLQLRELVELVEDELRDGAALHLEHDAHAVAVRLVTDVADVLDLLGANELRHRLDERGLVDLVGDLGDHDGGLLRVVLDPRPATHPDAAAARLERLPDAVAADDATRGEVGALHVLHELGRIDGRVLDHGDERIDYLAQVVRGHVGGHAHGNARGAVDEQVRYGRGQDGGLLELAVEVVAERDRFLLDVRQHGFGEGGEAGLGVAVGRGRVTVYRAEVPLPVHQPVTQVPVLRQPHHGVVDGAVAVRVVLADDLADHAGALRVLAVGRQAHLPHGEQDAALNRLEPVANVGERALHDDGHGVIDEARLDLVRDLDRDDLTLVQRDLRCLPAGAPPAPRGGIP